jgi:hypothetical protein
MSLVCGANQAMWDYKARQAWEVEKAQEEAMEMHHRQNQRGSNRWAPVVARFPSSVTPAWQVPQPAAVMRLCISANSAPAQDPHRGPFLLRCTTGRCRSGALRPHWHRGPGQTEKGDSGLE